MFFTARQFDAEEARAMGLVTGRARGGARELREELCRTSRHAPLTVNSVKYIVGES